MARAGVYIAVRRRGSGQGGRADGQPGPATGAAWAHATGRPSLSPEPAAPDPRPTAPPPPGAQAPRYRSGSGGRAARLAFAGLAGVLLLAVGVVLGLLLRPQGAPPSPEEFDRAVQRSLETAKLPATAARAWETIRPSVVRVQAFAAPPSEGGAGRKGVGRGGERPREGAQGTGTGVVILEQGVILTNLHVVAGARRVQVIFDDGLESDATVLSVQPQNDLAVLKAHRVPDDLVAATLRPSTDLLPGDRVVAIGFPFGIGPSVSAGVVSGLEREYQSEDGERVLGRLIQFDAAANPGNSGGPLVTDEGEVVGIVTGILNPVGQRFFVGIGFAVPIESAASGVGLPPF